MRLLLKALSWDRVQQHFVELSFVSVLKGLFRRQGSTAPRGGQPGVVPQSLVPGQGSTAPREEEMDSAECVEWVELRDDTAEFLGCGYAPLVSGSLLFGVLASSEYFRNWFTSGR